MILVTSQGCTASESLLAICVRTFVRPFTRMYSLMSGKRTGVTEGLWIVSMLLFEADDKLALPHRSHMWGFSPVWTRWWTVNADRWMNCL
jgi:hypothetical protein